MNILHIIFSFNNGGSENLLINLLNSWQNTNDKLFLCVVNDNYDETLINQLNNEVTVFKLNRQPGTGKLYGMSQLRKIVKDNEINIVHCHSNNVFKYSVMALFSFKSRIKFYLTIHNESIYPNLTKFEILLHQFFLNKIIAISNSVKKSILLKLPTQNIVSVVYNGIDLKKYEKKKNTQKNKNVILCIGRMVPPIKGQDVLLRALKLSTQDHENLECVFVGGNPENEDNISKLKYLACKLGVYSSVKFLGNCHNIPQLLQQASLLVVPSREEGFGLVAIEGMASYTPVIAAKVGGLTEIIQNGITGYLFEKENYVELAKLIDLVIEKNNDQLVQNAYEVAQNKFNIIRTAIETRNIYLNS